MMRKLYAFLALVSLVTPTEVEPSYYDFLERLGPKINTVWNYPKFIKDIKFARPLIVTIYYSKKHCLQCPQREQVIEDMLDRYYPQVEFHKYNCDVELETMEKEGESAIEEKTPPCHEDIDKLPIVTFRTPEEGVYYPYNVIQFKQPVVEIDFTQPDALGETIERYMPVYALKINNMKEATNYIEMFGHLNKTLYFQSEDQLPLYFKGLTSTFKDRLEVD